MNPATALLAAGEAEDKLLGHSRRGRHECHDGIAFENGERVPCLTMDEVMRPICERENIQTSGPDYALACRAVIEVLRVILGDTNVTRPNTTISREIVGKRAICLAWILDQGLFDESPSLRQLSKRYGVSAPLLAVITSEFRDRFGIYNGAQLAHDHSRMRFNSTKPDAVEATEETGKEEDFEEAT